MYDITNSIIHCFKPWTVAGFRDTVSDGEAGDWGASPSPAKWYFIGIVVVSSLEMWAETCGTQRPPKTNKSEVDGHSESESLLV